MLEGIVVTLSEYSTYLLSRALGIKSNKFECVKDQDGYWLQSEPQIKETKEFVSIDSMYLTFNKSTVSSFNDMIKIINRYSDMKAIKIEGDIKSSLADIFLLSAVTLFDLSRENVGLLIDKNTNIGEIFICSFTDGLTDAINLSTLNNKADIDIPRYRSYCNFISSDTQASHYDGILELKILGYSDLIESFYNRFKSIDLELLFISDKVLNKFAPKNFINSIIEPIIKDRLNTLIAPIVNNNYTETLEFWRYACDVAVLESLGYLSKDTIRKYGFNILLKMSMINPYIFELYLTNIDKYEGTNNFREMNVNRIRDKLLQ